MLGGVNSIQKLGAVLVALFIISFFVGGGLGIFPVVVALFVFFIWVFTRWLLGKGIGSTKNGDEGNFDAEKTDTENKKFILQYIMIPFFLAIAAYVITDRIYGKKEVIIIGMSNASYADTIDFAKVFEENYIGKANQLLGGFHPELSFDIVTVSGKYEEIWNALDHGRIDIAFISPYNMVNKLRSIGRDTLKIKKGGKTKYPRNLRRRDSIEKIKYRENGEYEVYRKDGMINAIWDGDTLYSKDPKKSLKIYDTIAIAQYPFNKIYKALGGKYTEIGTYYHSGFLINKKAIGKTEITIDSIPHMISRSNGDLKLCVSQETLSTSGRIVPIYWLKCDKGKAVASLNICEGPLPGNVEMVLNNPDVICTFSDDMWYNMKKISPKLAANFFFVSLDKYQIPLDAMVVKKENWNKKMGCWKRIADFVKLRNVNPLQSREEIVLQSLRQIVDSETSALDALQKSPIWKMEKHTDPLSRCREPGIQPSINLKQPPQSNDRKQPKHPPKNNCCPFPDTFKIMVIKDSLSGIFR